MNPTDHYRSHGYVVLPRFFDDVELLAMDTHVERVYQQWKAKNESLHNKKLVNMHSLTSAEYFQDSAEQRIRFFEVLASSKLTHMLESIFGNELYFHNTQLFFNPADDACLPYWHRDMQFSTIDDCVQKTELCNMLSLHVRIPFIKEKGVEVIAGTHKRWDTELEKNVRFERNGHKNSDSLPQSILIELLPGDILIFNAQMIHRGHYAANSQRKALDICIGKYHPLISGMLNQSVLPHHDEIEYIANNHWYKKALALFL